MKFTFDFVNSDKNKNRHGVLITVFYFMYKFKMWFKKENIVNVHWGNDDKEKIHAYYDEADCNNYTKKSTGSADKKVYVGSDFHNVPIHELFCIFVHKKVRNQNI